MNQRVWTSDHNTYTSIVWRLIQSFVEFPDPNEFFNRAFIINNIYQEYTHETVKMGRKYLI